MTRSRFMEKLLFFSGIILIGSLAIDCSKTGFTRSTPTKKTDRQPEQGRVDQDLDGEPKKIDNIDDSEITTIEEDRDEAKEFKMTCSNNDQPQIVNYQGKDKIVKVSGEICPQAFGKLTMLFVVDESGSMEDNSPRSDPKNLLGNCNRLRAAKEMVEKIKQTKRDKDQVEMGLITFSNNATQKVSIQALNEFEDDAFGILSGFGRLTFCGSDGATNYASAFNLAENTLRGRDGNKIIIFISDGLPTLGGGGGGSGADDPDGRHAQAGQNAAGALKTNIDRLTLHVAFLNQGANGANATSYLNTLKSTDGQVRIVNESSQLADNVVALSIPKIQLADEKPQAILSALGFGNTTVRINEFRPTNNRTDVWYFETDKFELHGNNNQTLRNELTITARSTDNQAFITKLLIDYRNN